MTLSLECSKKLYALLGDTYETEDYDDADDGWTNEITGKHEYIPLPSFAETIRLLPLISEKAKWPKPTPFRRMGRVENKVAIIAIKYMLAPTEEEGMKLVSEYLLKLL